MPTATCFLSGQYALLVDDASQKEYKVPSDKYRLNALNGSKVEYEECKEDVTLLEDFDWEDTEEEGESFKSISLKELQKRPTARILTVLSFPNDEFDVFISQTNRNEDRKSDEMLFLYTSNNVHLFAMVSDNPFAEMAYCHLRDELVEHRLEAKQWKFLAQVHNPDAERPIAARNMPAECVRVKVLKKLEIPASYKAAVNSKKDAAMEALGSPIEICSREKAVELPAFGGRWWAIDKKETVDAEQLFSVGKDGRELRFAVVLPLALLPSTADIVSQHLAGIFRQGETLFFEDEKRNLLGLDVTQKACWKKLAQEKNGKEKGKEKRSAMSRPALVLTLRPNFELQVGSISDQNVSFMSFEDLENELVRGKSLWTKLANELAKEAVAQPSSIPFEEGEEEYALKFGGKAPQVTPAKPVRCVQALLQSIRQIAEDSVSTQLQRHEEAGFRFLVREISAPQQCTLDTFFQPPFDAPISRILLKSTCPIAPRDQLRDTEHFTKEHLQQLRKLLPRKSSSSTDNAVACMRDTHLTELLKLCKRSHRFFKKGNPAEDFLRGVKDAVPFDKACRSAMSFLNQIFLLKTIRQDLPVELTQTVGVWYEEVRRFLSWDDDLVLTNVQKSMARAREACQSVRSLHFHRGMLSAPMMCEMYVVGLSSWRIKLKCSLTGVSLSTEVLQPYCLNSLNAWWQKKENGQSAVTLHFITEKQPTVLRMWDILPVWVLGVVENGEMMLRVVALCTNPRDNAESRRWLPVSSVRTASTWSDFHYYRLHENKLQYSTLEELWGVQFPPYLHKMVTDTLECSALPSASPQDPKKVSRRNTVQHPLVFTLDLWDSSDRNSFRLVLANQQSLHPCLKKFTQCKYGDKCHRLCFPRGACVQRCIESCGCMTEEQKEETKWLQYCRATKGFLAVIWFTRPNQGKGAAEGRSPALLYAFLERTGWDGWALKASLGNFHKLPMPHHMDAFESLRPNLIARALLFPMAPTNWVRLKTLCPHVAANVADNAAKEALSNAANPLLLNDNSLRGQEAQSCTREEIKKQLERHCLKFRPLEQQMDFLQLITSAKTKAQLPLLLGVAGTGKTTTLMHAAYLQYVRQLEAVVVYLAHTNQTVNAMKKAVGDAKEKGAFPGFVPVRVAARLHQTQDSLSRVEDIRSKQNLLCMTVDKFLLESDRWPAQTRIGFLIVDEVQSLPTLDLLVLRHQALKLGTKDFRMVLAGDPSQLKCMLKHAPLQQDLHVDYSRRAILLWAAANSGEAGRRLQSPQVPVVCLSRVVRLLDPELAPLNSVVYEGSIYPVALTCESSCEDSTRLPRLPQGLSKMMACAVEGGEERLPDDLRGPGVSPHTLYNKAQCDQALQLCHCVAHDSTQKWKVLIVSLYDGDRIYLEKNLEKIYANLKDAPEVEVVEKLGGKQADIVICITTRTRKMHNGRPRGLLSWSRNRVVTACTRHQRCFVLIACHSWITECWGNRLRHIWQFLLDFNSTVPSSPSTNSHRSSDTSIGYDRRGQSASSSRSNRGKCTVGGAWGTHQKKGEYRVSHVIPDRCAFLSPDIYYDSSMWLGRKTPKVNDLVTCQLREHKVGCNNWRVIKVFSVKEAQPRHSL